MELVKKILRISFWVILVAGLAMIFAFAQKQEGDLLCKKINITVLRDAGTENYFVEESAIRSLIAQKFGQVENTPLRNLDVNFLERLIYANPWVERSDV